MSGAAQEKRAHDVRTVLASAAHDADFQGDAVRLTRPQNGFVFVLDHTVDESDGTDTLDVYIQTKLDGTNWVDVVHFKQHLGNKGAERRLAKVVAGGPMLEYDNATALAQQAVRHMCGDEWRVNGVIVDGSGSASFTFSVVAIPM